MTIKSGTLVVIEQKNGDVKRSSLEAVSAGLAIESARGGSVFIAVIGNEVQGALQAVSNIGAKKVYSITAPELATYSTEGFCRAAAGGATACDAGLVLVAASTHGRDLAPAVAATLSRPSCSRR